MDYYTQSQTCVSIWNIGVPDFPGLKALIHELIYVKNDIYSATIKYDNGAIAMRNFFVKLKCKQQLNQLKN